MKKKEFDFNKFIKERDIYVNKMAPTGFFAWSWLIALLIGGLCLDLQEIFNVDLIHFRAVLGLIFSISLGYCISWIISLLIYAVLTVVYKKKYPQYDFDTMDKDQVDTDYKKAKIKWLNLCIERTEKKEGEKHEDK